jgi:hypothetical protein
MRTQLPAAHFTPQGASASRASVARSLVAFTSLVILAVLFAFGAIGSAQKLPWPNVGEDPIVTPVVGPSWADAFGHSSQSQQSGTGFGAIWSVP